MLCSNTRHITARLEGSSLFIINCQRSSIRTKSHIDKPTKINQKKWSKNMDRRGGCCIARYSEVMSKVNQIMLKFRPIAPKPAPVSIGAGFAGSLQESNERISLKSGRVKRKTNKIITSDSYKKRKASPEETWSSDSLVTPPFLSETPERKQSTEKEKSQSPILLSFGRVDGKQVSTSQDGTAVMVLQPIRIATSVVMVECVTDTCLDGFWLNDQEKIAKLARDTCPGFISDSFNQVVWTNEAYGELVGNANVIVWLVMKDRVPLTCNAFSSRVRLQSTCRKEKGSMILPCDAWRMDGGGFAWRLDVEAALCLGR